MPVPTLQNFGVPLGNGQRAGILMPKVKNRFQVLVYNFGGFADTVDFTRQIISASRPNVQFPPQAAHSYNSIAYYAGKAEWEPVTVTVRDDITNAVARLCGAQIQRQMNFFDQTVPVAAANFKFTMSVQTMDGGNNGDGSILESWIYEGCFLASANYEGFEYSSADAMTIEMSIRFDNATQTGGLMPETGLHLETGTTI